MQSKGRIEVSEDIIFDATDFNRLAEAIEEGKEATRLATIEEVQASPKDFGISTSASAIESVKGCGGGHAGSVSYAVAPAGYDLAIVAYHDCDNTNGLRNTAGLTYVGSGSDPNDGTIHIYVQPLNGSSANVNCGGGWGDAYVVGVVKMK